MADTIRIQLADAYEPVTEQQIGTAKNYVLRREQAVRGLSQLIDALLEDAAEEMTKIAYRYGIDPSRFQITPQYNEKMFDEMADVLNNLEEEILDLTCSYATKCTEDKEKKPLLLLWVMALGKNNSGLRKSLEDRLWVFSRDVEAMIVAMKSARYGVATAVRRIKESLHSVYVTPEVVSLFRFSHRFMSTYIRSKGVKHGYVGNSNSEANNVIRFVRTTVQLGWMHQMEENYKSRGAVGYWVARGSNYPCEICDMNCGFHTIDQGSGLPVHPSCCCYAVPIYEKDIQQQMQ